MSKERNVNIEEKYNFMVGDAVNRKFVVTLNKNSERCSQHSWTSW